MLEYLNVDKSVSYEISKTGNGNYIYNQLKTHKQIDTFTIVEFIILLDKINKVKKWMLDRFGET
jgi:hypothetical protein